MPLAQLTPEMRPVVEQLKTGDVSAPVQSAAGFHILKLADLRPASVTPFDQVKGELRAALRSQRQELAARAYLEGLLNAGTVSIDGAALNAAFEQTAPARRRRRRERQALRRRSLCPRWRGAWMAGCCRRWARPIRPSASRARRP
ncbi:peptidylprolyl isomerase [Achromobacter xylosoxidans]